MPTVRRPGDLQQPERSARNASKTAPRCLQAKRRTAGSLALLSGAAHMFTDAAALAISLAAMQIGKRIADKKRTFGCYRFEIPAEIQSTGMLIIATMGFLKLTAGAYDWVMPSAN